MLTDNFQTSKKYETVIGLANGTIFVGIRETWVFLYLLTVKLHLLTI